METITFTINGQTVKGQVGNTIFEVAQSYGIPIPTLCHDPYLTPIGACRVCLVEDEKTGNFITSCSTPIAKGMSVRTNSKKVIETRKVLMKLMLASHPESCIVCEKGNRCKLRQIAANLGIGYVDYYPMPSFTGTQELNPFIRRDLSKCIACAKCIRADHELVVEGAIDYIYRGFEARPATLTDGPLEISECTFCGTCLEICPTGALFETDKRFHSSTSKHVPTTCPFCGCGCSFWLEVSHNQAVGVRPGISGSVNGITLCAKGHFGYECINHPNRIQKPLIRKEGVLAEASWDEALQAAAQGFKSIKEKNGQGSLALIACPHCTNEEAFLLKKFASDVLETDHLGCSSTEYMSNLIPAMEETVGFVGPGGSIQDLEDAEAILLIGANPTETAPIVGYSIKRAIRKKQAALIVIDPLEIKLTKYADLWLRPNVGTDEILLLGFLNLLMKDKDFKKGLTDEGTKYFKEIKKWFKDFSLDDVPRKTGVSLEGLKRAVEIYCSAGKKAIVFGNGLLQQPAGQNLVKILGSLLALARKKTTIFPLVKQSNAMGCFHMGLINDENPETIFPEILNGHIKGLWITGDDPLVSPAGVKEIERALDKLEFLVVSDSFLSCTAKKAHVVFPSATFAEKTGTVTSMEGRVQMIHPAIDCVGESRPDWEIISLMAGHLGVPFNYKSEKDVTEEVIKRIALYKKMDLSAAENDYFSYKLPLSSTKKKQAVFVPEKASGKPAGSRKYPYTLMMGSIVFQLGHGHQTQHSPKLCKMMDEEYVELNPEDATKEGLQGGDFIQLISADGEKAVKVRLTDKVPSGVLFLPLPFARYSTLIPLSGKSIGLNTCQIKIERVTS